jgi:hypothetical protein
MDPEKRHWNENQCCASTTFQSAMWTGFMSAVTVINFTMHARTLVMIFMMTAQTSGLKMMMMATMMIRFGKVLRKISLSSCLQVSLYIPWACDVKFPIILQLCNDPQGGVTMKREREMDVGLKHCWTLLKCTLHKKLLNCSFMHCTNNKKNPPNLESVLFHLKHKLSTTQL